jgi:hypothetical protein
MCTAVVIGLDPATHSREALLVRHNRRHLFETPSIVTVWSQTYWYSVPFRGKHFLRFRRFTESEHKREGMGLLEYQALPFLRYVAHDGWLCTFTI